MRAGIVRTLSHIIPCQWLTVWQRCTLQEKNFDVYEIHRVVFLFSMRGQQAKVRNLHDYIGVGYEPQLESVFQLYDICVTIFPIIDSRQLVGVNSQNAASGRQAESAGPALRSAGKMQLNLLPAPITLSISRRAWWAFSTCLTMDRPSPVPPVRRPRPEPTR